MTSKVRCQNGIDLVAAKAFRCRVHDASLRNNSNVGRAGADVDYRRRTFIVCEDARAKSSSESLFHHIDLADAGLVRGIEHSPLLHVSYVRDHTHYGLNRDIRAAG